jgi:hypothetical protein
MVGGIATLPMPRRGNQEDELWSIAVLRRSVPRPRIRFRDRVYGVLFRRLWSSWRDSLLIVRPFVIPSPSPCTGGRGICCWCRPRGGISRSRQPPSMRASMLISCVGSSSPSLHPPLMKRRGLRSVRRRARGSLGTLLAGAGIHLRPSSFGEVCPTRNA